MAIKKFKIRVKHFNNEYYIIQYAYYYFIPFYKTLYDFNYYLGWEKIFMKYKDAEKLSSKLQSIESIIAFCREKVKDSENMKRIKKEYIIDNIPYDKKYIS